ncbi:MAG: hypothetical protein U0441_27655 [Polyangiaceae bacterium]
MIRLQRPDEPPRFAAEVTVAYETIEKLVQTGNPPEDGDFVDKWGMFKHVFANAHDRKCAYCESRFGANYPGDVEHYRPKTMVKDATTRGERDDTKDQSPGRKWGKAVKPGYWWLAYTWTNYLLACKNCNSTWKANQFPLKGIRAKLLEGVERQEAPLLLNPYDTDPAPHLVFDEMGGVKGRTLEGKKTVDVCGLDRRTLEIEREIVAQRVLADIDEYGLACGQDNMRWQNRCLSRLLEACHEKVDYAGMSRQLVAQQLGISYEELLEADALGLLE